MEEKESDLETGFKVVAIMQTITEELDESGKRIWRKMLGQEQSAPKRKQKAKRNG